MGAAVAGFALLGGVAAGQLEVVASVGEDDALLLFCETDDGWRQDIQSIESFNCCLYLADTPVYNDQVRQSFLLILNSPISSFYDFPHGAKVIIANKALNFEISVLSLVRGAVAEVNH